MEKILKLLKQNARLSNDQLAAMLDTTAEDVAGQIASLEARGIIKGYKPIIDYEKIDSEIVTAIIELKVTPQKDFGFEEIAKRIVEYNEVDSVYLMSGGYDLSVTVKGKTFKDIALFVAHRLAPLDSVISTATHFVLSCYKDTGIVLCDASSDERGHYWL